MGQYDGIHWFELLQSAGILGGFLFTAYSIRRDNQARRISTLNAVVDRHREIWKTFHDRPELSRVLEKAADPVNQPASRAEETFVNQLIIHLDTVHRAIKTGMFVELKGLQADVEQFFSLPIPRAVWNKSRPLRDADFVRFVEAALK